MNCSPLLALPFIEAYLASTSLDKLSVRPAIGGRTDSNTIPSLLNKFHLCLIKEPFAIIAAFVNIKIADKQSFDRLVC